MAHRRFSFRLVLLGSLILASCALRGPLGGQGGLSSTADAIRTQAVGTVLAKLTAGAVVASQPTETPVPSPTAVLAATPLPPTPSPIPSITSTATPQPTQRTYPTFTFTPAQLDFVCEIEKIEPAPDQTLKVGAAFDLAVRLKNSGQKSWQPMQVFFLYTSGQKLQVSSGPALLRARIDPGGETSFSAPATAPESPGTYKTTWALSTNGLFFCPVHFQVVVSP